MPLDAIRTLTGHNTVRDYTDQPVSEEDRQLVLRAALMSSSTCFLQITSIIRITCPEKRRQLAECAGGQPHVISAPEFWVFCGDYRRNLEILGHSDLGWTDQLIVACTDTGIMAQSAMAAVESLGMGGCFIGGLRNQIARVGEILELPEHVMPVVGLTFGWPSERHPCKPRLPQSVTVMENAYAPADPAVVEAYETRMRAYYAERGGPKKSWIENLERILKRERRPHVLAYLQSKGWALK